MKRILITILVVAVALVMTGCGKNKTYEEISYIELKEKIDDKEDFILFIGAESCSACSAYKITVNKIIENYNLDIKYINLDNFSEEEYNYVKSLTYFTGTPTTVFFKDGKEDKNKEKITGNTKYSKAVKSLKENGYIKED